MGIFELAEIFCDGMIFQRNMEIKIYGTANEKCDITVKLEEDEVTKSVNKGFFIISLPPRKEGENLTLIVSSNGQKEVIKNVYCGEVFIAGGQSNIAIRFKDTDGYKNGEEIENNEKVRLYGVGKNSVFREDFEEAYRCLFNEDKKWSGCKRSSVLNFSAVSYYFATKLQKQINVPVGIISCNVGGSSIFCWMPEEAILSNDDIKDVLLNYQKGVKEINMKEHKENFYKYAKDIMTGYEMNEDVYYEEVGAEWPYIYFEEFGPYSYMRPCGLYHIMLKKIINFSVRGMIWYQGESESFSESSSIYKSAMCSLLGNIKKVSGNKDFEMFFVQLPPYKDPKIRDWEGICNAQREYYLENPRNAMITIGDCSGVKSIHPTIKKPVGIRLASAALNKLYNIPEEYCGPCAVSAVYKNKEKLIEIDFIHNDKMYTDENIGKFEVEDIEGKVKKHKAYLRDNKVYVEYRRRIPPKNVRYAWCTYPHIGLFNSSNLPASVFKIDVQSI